jgi:hypothetical protein
MDLDHWRIPTTLCNKKNVIPILLTYFPTDLSNVVRNYLGIAQEERLNWLMEHHKDPMFVFEVFDVPRHLRNGEKSTLADIHKLSNLVHARLPPLWEELNLLPAIFKLESVPLELCQEYQKATSEIVTSIMKKAVQILTKFGQNCRNDVFS